MDINSIVFDSEDADRINNLTLERSEFGIVHIIRKVSGNIVKTQLSKFLTGAEAHEYVIHRNGNKSDFRKENLYVTNSTELQLLKPLKNGKIRGAVWDAEAEEWMMSLKIRGRTIHCHGFQTKEEAGASAIMTLAHILGSESPFYRDPRISEAVLEEVADKLLLRKRYLRSCYKLRELYQSGETNKIDHAIGIDKHQKKWRVRIRLKGKQKYIGAFTSEDKAYKAYRRAKFASMSSPRRD